MLPIVPRAWGRTGGRSPPERDRRHVPGPYDGAVLVKWIRCTVVDRRGFERGQRKWAGLLGEPGFRGQGGGWSRGRPGVAHIFAFWESRAFYDSFMARSHDRLAAAQSGTFKDAQSKLFDHRFDVKTGFEPRFTDDRSGPGGALSRPRGARRALRADAGEGVEPGDGRLARHGAGPLRRGARPRVPGPVHVAVGRRARQIPGRACGAARPAGPDSRRTSRRSRATSSSWNRPGRSETAAIYVTCAVWRPYECSIGRNSI